jgi:uncharacterized phage protein (TIGR01671 family)
MREIKFRAQDFTGTWQYGFIVKGNETAIIIPVNKNGSVAMGINIYVKPETVGQFTGLTDEFDREVYEGDIIMLDGSPEMGVRVVVFYEESFNIATRKEYDYLQQGSHPYLNDYAHMDCLNTWSNSGLVRIVGNIYDNPELLK